MALFVGCATDLTEYIDDFMSQINRIRWKSQLSQRLFRQLLIMFNSIFLFAFLETQFQISQLWVAICAIDIGLYIVITLIPTDEVNSGIQPSYSKSLIVDYRS